MPLGALAQAYLKKDGLAACDDLLEDARRVSLQLLVDNPSTIYDLLKFYGYSRTDISGTSMWCVGGDPLAGVSLRFKYREPRGSSSTGNNEIRLHMTFADGSSQEVYLSELISFYNLDVRYADCNWQLQRPGMSIPRRVYDTDCIYNGSESDRSLPAGQSPSLVDSGFLSSDSASSSDYVPAGRDWTRWQRFDESRREPQSDRVQPFAARSKYPAIANDAAKGL